MRNLLSEAQAYTIGDISYLTLEELRLYPCFSEDAAEELFRFMEEFFLSLDWMKEGYREDFSHFEENLLTSLKEASEEEISESATEME